LDVLFDERSGRGVGRQKRELHAPMILRREKVAI
jgi:hypothetical protein